MNEREQIADPIDEAFVNLTIVLLGASPKTTEIVKSLPDDKQELIYRVREKAITSILALLKEQGWLGPALSVSKENKANSEAKMLGPNHDPDKYLLSPEQIIRAWYEHAEEKPDDDVEAWMVEVALKAQLAHLVEKGWIAPDKYPWNPDYLKFKDGVKAGREGGIREGRRQIIRLAQEHYFGHLEKTFEETALQSAIVTFPPEVWEALLKELDN